MKYFTNKEDFKGNRFKMDPEAVNICSMSLEESLGQ